MRILHLISLSNFIVLCVCNEGDPGEGEVDDGRIDRDATEVEAHTYPFVVLINGTRGYANQPRYQSICHGVLVAPSIVVGTANPGCHNFSVRALTLVAGMHNVQIFENTVQRREICHIDIHPNASKINQGGNRTYAYALYHTSDPFVFNNYVKNAKFPMPNEISDMSGISSCMFVSHSNRQAISIMREKELNITSCDAGAAAPTVFCTQDGPGGDAGAPLICTKGNREFVAGVYSGFFNQNPRYFSAFYNKDFQNWYNEKVSTLPKACAPRH